MTIRVADVLSNPCDSGAIQNTPCSGRKRLQPPFS